jgi:tRNA nucleotidyltransferase (CCA-adding enzyme)
MKNYNSILEKVLEKIEPSKEERKEIDEALSNFKKKILPIISKLKKKPQILVGGSYAKNTLVKKDKYDIDVFLRFDKNEKDISEETKKFLKGFQNVSVVHGSRDYFRIKVKDNLFIELVPVTKVNSPEQSENITDLSCSHVKYINTKIKSKKILDEIKIAKAFCHANNCYGAESYINGFSGYSLELLVYHYKSFIKMIKELSKKTEGKIIIDTEKHYKQKKNVLLDMNSSKLGSPIILVDPTYKQRNALAALSEETFERFKKACKIFLKNPSLKSFEEKKVDLKKIKNNSEKNKNEFILIETGTDKQEGDIAGSKLFKFYNHLSLEIERFFEIKNKGFNYNGEKSARYFFVLKKKKDVLFEGPFKEDKMNSTKFIKAHRKVIVKKGKLFAKEDLKHNSKEFIKDWVSKNKNKIKDMSINYVKIMNN